MDVCMVKKVSILDLVSKPFFKNCEFNVGPWWAASVGNHMFKCGSFVTEKWYNVIEFVVFIDWFLCLCLLYTILECYMSEVGDVQP